MATRTSTTKNHSEIKLQRIIEHNKKLREQLDLPRIKVSQASSMLIKYVQSTKDYLVPSVWGTAGTADPFNNRNGVYCTECVIS
ncbi:3283_t:CDS:2 [Entrophospora sp. SA101]|nr:3468_t:CDS:2 [Entrophospora sp. SA101]CAJ0641707.1 12297_t:CDS:2 [Entrophospora sp. SA101]CAJ0759962.1 3283_t:CDS:2 [Entrophospora sp. SA101]CAJ0857333.1 10758_t:CDS:2 [Entrophospora sp. SA101]CAJ0862390.1 2697_t:CDS:2 [Entrophospora sp. SA101]